MHLTSRTLATLAAVVVTAAAAFAQGPAPGALDRGVALWDQRLANGAVLTAGDKVTFKPVSLREYDQIRAEDISATTLMQLTH